MSKRVVHIPMPIVQMEPGTLVRDRLSKHEYRFVRSSEVNVVLQRCDTNLPLFVSAHEWAQRFARNVVELIEQPKVQREHASNEDGESVSCGTVEMF
jgi:hypothetical protein